MVRLCADKFSDTVMTLNHFNTEKIVSLVESSSIDIGVVSSAYTNSSLNVISLPTRPVEWDFFFFLMESSFKKA